jgi:fimbrial isopeptide formation D2 family protein/LPXTG-motif cell wall-anchored protein
MNLTKKLFSYIVAIAMIFTLTAFAGGAVNAADTTYKLTLNGTTKGHTYEAYQVFTGDLSTNTDGDKVLSNVQWGEGVTYTQVTGENKSAADVAKALGDGTMTTAQLINQLTLTTPVKTVNSSTDSTSTVIDKLAAGYYLVKDKDGTQANTSDAYTKFIVKVVGDSEANVKSGVPTVEKKVKDTNDSIGETSTSGWQDSADYDIGDDVPYQITGTMPDNIGDYTTYKYIFTDTMSKGLSFKTGSAKIMIGTTEVTGKFTENVTTNDDGSTVTWTCNDLKGIDGVTVNKDTTVVVTYKATLNKKAVIGSAGNPNTVNLTYSNNPNKGGEGETGKTPDDKNIVFTYKAVVNKVDQGKKSLAGAGFTLQKKVNGAYTDVKSFTAGEATKFEFTGLDDGDYKLIESTTPEGYNTITPIEFTISATHDETADEPTLISLTTKVTTGVAAFTADKDAGSLTTDVVNKKGSTLPETGGMGTTLLYAVGGVLVALAAAYIIISKKHEKAE